MSVEMGRSTLAEGRTMPWSGILDQTEKRKPAEQQALLLLLLDCRCYVTSVPCCGEVPVTMNNTLKLYAKTHPSSLMLVFVIGLITAANIPPIWLSSESSTFQMLSAWELGVQHMNLEKTWTLTP